MNAIRTAFTIAKWTAFATLAVFSGLFLWVMWSVDSPKDNRIVAIYYCQAEIKRQLSDPSSVEWIDRLNWPAREEGGVWTVQAVYRANNAFGGKVVDTATCHIRETETGDLSPLVLITE